MNNTAIEYKVGDPVIIYGPFDNFFALADVVNVSDKKKDVTVLTRLRKKKLHYNRNGRSKKINYDGSYGYIVPATEENLNKEKDKRAISLCKECLDDVFYLFDNKELTAKMSRDIIDLLRKYENHIPALKYHNDLSGIDYK